MKSCKPVCWDSDVCASGEFCSHPHSLYGRTLYILLFHMNSIVTGTNSWLMYSFWPLATLPHFTCPLWHQSVWFSTSKWFRSYASLGRPPMDWAPQVIFATPLSLSLSLTLFSPSVYQNAWHIWQVLRSTWKYKGKPTRLVNLFIPWALR